ncbi:MAG TPA: hypothetical protein VHW46_07550 [Terracidiphilus sp.]|nr:hypothetical protein [Terracidiphilus sp.]
MQRRYCEEGLRLDTNYFEKTRAWVATEADKRVAVAAGTGITANDWTRIARRVDGAKACHEEAFHAYMEHVIACPVCNAHVPTSAELIAHQRH